MSKLEEGQRTCPECKSSWDGGSILETFIKGRDDGSHAWNKDMTDEEIEEYVKNSYSPPYRWGREIGVELPYNHPRHYDGISYWQCPDCKATFNRFTGEKEEIGDGQIK
jgi:rubredoxin